MTALELARILKGRRYAKGRYMARCPAHPDRTGSLSITEMPDGVRVHCFAGCAQKSVLNAMVLDWRDLKPNRRVDPEIVRQIREQTAKYEASEKHRRWLKNEALHQASVWSAISDGLGSLLAGFPEDKRLSSYFHRALSLQRHFEAVADLVDLKCARGQGSPPLGRVLRRSDVPRVLAVRLGLHK